ncbi:MAG TPA: DsrE family protein [Povalibacter sp.]|nr:DsrE family protein [Povalibacter sp.]
MPDPDKTLTFLLMDPPFESARTATAFRLLDVAARRGLHVNVFAYEGAVALPFAAQKQHANSVHNRTIEEEQHPLPKDWVAAVMRTANAAGGQVEWVNCGLCVDERGVADAVAGVRRGSPADFWKMSSSSRNTLVIASR